MKSRLSKKQGEELDILAKRGRGILDARKVVEFARDDTTALHKMFEWDDGKAAEQYRVHQARMVIQCHVKYMATDGKPVRTRVFMSLPSHRGEQKFRRIDDILKRKDWREEMIEMAKSELGAVRRKYEILSELKIVWDVIDGL